MHRYEIFYIGFTDKDLSAALHRGLEPAVHREKSNIRLHPCDALHLLLKGVFCKFSCLSVLTCPVPPVEITSMKDALA